IQAHPTNAHAGEAVPRGTARGGPPGQRPDRMDGRMDSVGSRTIRRRPGSVLFRIAIFMAPAVVDDR
ncbi:MAG TPA: hypothetical protein VIL95_00680, partial [Bacillota bacterium]